MNYIILNGVKSNTINGLLIQSLPAISKPLMRTQIDTIDGRDGDIVTPLGYSAYDKSFDVGLYGDYDIDEVIAFFNSSGTVTFSNEDDKYYNYEIIDQIDFERLIRFKKAMVTMHLQPFKYSLVDKLKNFAVQATPANLVIRNNGNIKSKPKITIHGGGTVILSLNGAQIFTINLRSEPGITIDTARMEAYNDSGLKNRIVTGDYDNFALSVGKNEIEIAGDVTAVEIENFSRWI